jgi:hypothetical protein
MPAMVRDFAGRVEVAMGARAVVAA